MIRPIRFTDAEAIDAGEAWSFNCGPGALCAVLNKNPAEIRPGLLDFEEKGYTNPTLMTGILDHLGVKWRLSYRSDEMPEGLAKPMLAAMCKFLSRTDAETYALLRVQWGGPWTKPGVPMRVRYRKTHWIAVRLGAEAHIDVFDINAVGEGGWISWNVWENQLVPWLLEQCVPDADGDWWVTHALEVELPLTETRAA